MAHYTLDFFPVRAQGSHASVSSGDMLAES